MELHQLRYFCAVAETGSFSRAAEQSHVSQPSLSQQIQKLENELGARLFDRLGRSIRLTDLGKAFLPRARGVLRELEAARGDVVERKETLSGTVAIGVIPTVAPYLLPPLLTSYSRKYPQVEVSIVEEMTSILLDRLRAGNVDVAVLAYHCRRCPPRAFSHARPQFVPDAAARDVFGAVFHAEGAGTLVVNGFFAEGVVFRANRMRRCVLFRRL